MACPVVSAPCGQVKGRLSNVPEVSGAKQVYAYLGIPYAKPPVGDLRFEPPQKNTPWEGILEATTQPLSPAQDNVFSKPQKEFVVICNQYHESAFENTNEDCLYLNVFTSNPSKNAEMPILFWIYGGGMQEGGIDGYDPQVLCSLHDVIVIMPNYRVNALGFLTLGTDTKYKGNMGLKDQILALEWVRDNAKEFGGNPGNVTIFGESAGSVAVSCHMVSPVSRDLFHKSIHHSGTIDLPVLAPKEYTNYLKRFLKRLEITETQPEAIIKKLKSLPAEKILRAQREEALAMQFFSVAVDGEIIPNELNTLIKNKAYSKVPSIVGCNNTEGGKIVTLGIPNYNDKIPKKFLIELLKGILAGSVIENKLQKAVQAIIEFYSRDIDDTNEMRWSMVYSRFLGDSWFVVPSIQQANIHSDISSGNTYFYQMTQQLRMYHEDGYGDARKKADYCECDHGDDIIFTFGFPFYNGPTTLKVKYSEDEKDLSRKWMTYLVNFAKTGNPNKGEKVDVEWPKYNRQTKQNLTVQIPLTVGDNLSKEAVRFWTETFPSL